MSRKSKKRQAHKSRRSRYVKRKSSPTVSFARTGVVSDRTFAKLKYNEIIGLTSVTYAGGYTFTGNGLFDCNITSTGTQPTGFDQYMNLYDSFRVHSSKVRVSVANTTTSSAVVFATVPCRDYASVISGGINEVIRMPRARYAMVAADFQETKTVSNFLSTKKAFGEKELDDIVYSGSSSGNPSDQWYWVLFGANVSGGGTLSVQLHVQITYYVEFMRRKDLSIS